MGPVLSRLHRSLYCRCHEELAYADPRGGLVLVWRLVGRQSLRDCTGPGVQHALPISGEVPWSGSSLLRNLNFISLRDRSLASVSTYYRSFGGILGKFVGEVVWRMAVVKLDWASCEALSEVARCIESPRAAIMVRFGTSLFFSDTGSR